MIENHRGEWYCSCDCCSSGEETLDGDEYETFQQVADHLKELGWKIGKDRRGEWEHICDGCCEEDLKSKSLADF